MKIKWYLYSHSLCCNVLYFDTKLPFVMLCAVREREFLLFPESSNFGYLPGRAGGDSRLALDLRDSARAGRGALDVLAGEGRANHGAASVSQHESQASRFSGGVLSGVWRGGECKDPPEKLQGTEPHEATTGKKPLLRGLRGAAYP
jgi:hypothetical protein